MAGKIGGVIPLALQRPDAAAGGHLRLPDGSVPVEGDFLKASLPRIVCAVGMAVVEDIPVVADLFHAAVVVGRVVHRFVRRLVAADPLVAAGDNDALVLESARGFPAHGIGQLVELDGGVDKVVEVPALADGGRLEELVPFKAGALAVHHARSDEHRRFRHSQHILLQHGGHGAVAAFVPVAAEARIQVGLFPFGQHAGVELRFVPFPLSQPCSVRVMDIPVKFIRARGIVRHGGGDASPGAQHIVQVIPSVRPHRHVRRVKVPLHVRVVRVLVLPVDHALTAPVPQVILRCGPAHIIPGAVHIAAEEIMGAVHIYPVPEKIGLSVRHIFPVRKIWVDHLFFIHFFDPPPSRRLSGLLLPRS